jgi:sugar phosphate isomerase/epimerase
MTLEDFIDFCAAQGVAGTELTSYYFRRTDREYLVALKRRAFLNGLTVTGVPVGNNFCLPPGEERRQQIAHVKSWIEHAAVLGAPCMRIFAGSPPRGGSEEQAREWAIECLRETAKHAAEFGVVLALENHGGITSSAAQLLRLIEEADSPWLGVNLDTGNFQQNPYAEIEKVAPRAVVVQHKVEVRGPSGHEPADFPRILGILEAAGYRGVIALEYEARANPLEAVPRHLAAMRRALAERA